MALPEALPKDPSLGLNINSSAKTIETKFIESIGLAFYFRDWLQLFFAVRYKSIRGWSNKFGKNDGRRLFMFCWKNIWDFFFVYWFFFRKRKKKVFIVHGWEIFCFVSGLTRSDSFEVIWTLSLGWWWLILSLALILLTIQHRCCL